MGSDIHIIDPCNPDCDVVGIFYKFQKERLHLSDAIFGFNVSDLITWYVHTNTHYAHMGNLTAAWANLSDISRQFRSLIDIWIKIDLIEAQTLFNANMHKYIPKKELIPKLDLVRYGCKQIRYE